MNRVELLQRTPAVALSVFDHAPGDVHVDPEAERAGSDTISFVEHGTFEVRAEGARGEAPWRFAPGMLLVVPRGATFACRHEHECPDDRCLSVAIAPEAMAALRDAGVAALAPTALAESPRLRFLRHRLRAADGDPLRLELLAGALVEAVASGASEPGRHRGGEPPVTDVMRRVARAAELAEAEHARPLRLEELAAAAGMSPFHFARVFHRLTGLPPHRWLTAVRLRHALARLEQGASVTHACYDSGFASLSHFVTAFRRRFGMTPSAAKRAPASRRAELRAALSAPLWK